jgi:hypothetical protein
MADKKFNKKFMHPTRRKLVDMVMTGEYQKDTQVSFATTKQEEKREIGDVWEDDKGNVWEQKSYGKVKQSKLTNTMSEVRNYLQKLSSCKADDCSKTKFGPTDKKLISKTGFCSKCLAEREQIIRNDGLWDAYNEYKVYSNMASYGTEVIEKMNNALDDVSNIHEFVNGDGSVEQWKSDKSVDELRAEIEKDIENGKKELIEVIEKRNAAYELLKDKNYELVQPL